MLVLSKIRFQLEANLLVLFVVLHFAVTSSGIFRILVIRVDVWEQLTCKILYEGHGDVVRHLHLVSLFFRRSDHGIFRSGGRKGRSRPCVTAAWLRAPRFEQMCFTLR